MVDWFCSRVAPMHLSLILQTLCALLLVPSVNSRGAQTMQASESISKGRNGRLNFACDPASMISRGSLTCRKSATWGKWLYFPSEGRHAEDFFTFQPGLNPQTLVPEVSMLTTRPPKLLRWGGICCTRVQGDNVSASWHRNKVLFSNQWICCLSYLYQWCFIVDKVFEGADSLLHALWFICCLYVRLARIFIGVMYLFLCYYIDGGKVIPLHMMEVCVGNGGKALLIRSRDTR
jgi:hypothetical protein